MVGVTQSVHRPPSSSLSLISLSLLPLGWLQSLLPSVSDRALWVTVPDWCGDWGGFLQGLGLVWVCVSGSGFPETNWRKGMDGREGKRGDGGEGERR